MAKPRVFVSSTYYDLKDIRASLARFVESLGFEPVLSERGDITYLPDQPLDESCYGEAAGADLYVLIVGGRYGSEASADRDGKGRGADERYESITKMEYEAAVKRGVPVYILVEANVHAEYRTFLQNKGRRDVRYAHVESENVFHLLEEILSKRQNNPVQPFGQFADIESWLRDQWAGLFRELLARRSQQKELTEMSAQLGELREVSATLKQYMEAVLQGVGETEAHDLVAEERSRLARLERDAELHANRIVNHLEMNGHLQFKAAVRAIETATSMDDFVKRAEASEGWNSGFNLREVLLVIPDLRRALNHARRILGLGPLANDLSDGDPDAR
ncbi:MAG: DUF4062 domain-containing protein [Phycisphaerales bacterium]|nr:DUF4062 domain-containing protein [Phycisphaerales bacterium]